MLSIVQLMQANNDRYELPENTGSSIKKMYLWLGAFFGGLILIGLLVIIFAQSLVKLIPFKAEERLVEPIERLIVVDPDNVSEEHKFVQSYLENLVSGLEKSGEVSGKVKFKIHYSDKLVENAFATLGGHMVVYRGLMENVESENGLAMIIAHEMAHIENRDPAAGMGRAFAIQIMIASLSGGYSEGIVDLLSQAGFNQFSSKQEREADIFALDILNRHYGHVGGSREFSKTGYYHILILRRD